MATVAPPEGRRAWVVMVAAFVNQMLVFGVLKSGGVMYMAIMDEMDVTHTQAALASNIAFGISPLMGPISITLVSRFSPKYVIFTGGFMAASGMAIAATYTSSIIFITFLYGALVGISCGFITTPNLVTVHAYFNKNRAFASSFVLAGGSVGSFFVPPLVEHFAKEHGLRAAFLTLSALFLHVCPSSLLFRPIDGSKQRRRTKCFASDDSETNQSSVNTKGLKESEEVNGDCVEETVLFLKPSRKTDGMLKTNNKTTGNIEGAREEPLPGLLQRFLRVARLNLSLFNNKYYLMVLYSTMSHVFIWTGYLTLLPDFAYHESADEITKSMAALLLSAMSGGDVIFRIVFGWVSDCGWFQRKHYYSFFLLVSGSILACYSVTQTYASLLTSSVFFGVFIGGANVLPPLLLNDFLGPDRFPMAYAINVCLYGPVTFAAPPLLAYIREVTGSYKPCFLIMGLLLLSAGLVWVFDEVYITAFPPTQDYDEGIGVANGDVRLRLKKAEPSKILHTNSAS